MALDKDVLGALMKSKLEALTNFPSPSKSPVIPDDRVLKALADAIVTHITSAGVVQPGTFSNGFGPITGQGVIE
jgi:hypothetical protein